MADNEDQDKSFAEFLWGALPEAGRQQLEQNMSAGTLEDTKSELTRCIEEAVNDAYAAGREQGWGVGCAAGRAVGRGNARLEAVLTVLDARGIDVPGGPPDPFVGVGSSQLTEWIRRAATANSFDELLA